MLWFIGISPKFFLNGAHSFFYKPIITTFLNHTKKNASLFFLGWVKIIKNGIKLNNQNCYWFRWSYWKRIYQGTQNMLLFCLKVELILFFQSFVKNGDFRSTWHYHNFIFCFYTSLMENRTCLNFLWAIIVTGAVNPIMVINLHHINYDLWPFTIVGILLPLAYGVTAVWI